MWKAGRPFRAHTLTRTDSHVPVLQILNSHVDSRVQAAAALCQGGHSRSQCLVDTIEEVTSSSVIPDGPASEDALKPDSRSIDLPLLPMAYIKKKTKTTTMSTMTEAAAALVPGAVPAPAPPPTLDGTHPPTTPDSVTSLTTGVLPAQSRGKGRRGHARTRAVSQRNTQQVCVGEGQEDGTQVRHLEREIEEGNREYKWKLVRPSEERIAHLTTQLNWRLNESANGEAFYLLGVRDDGFCEGISDIDLRESLTTLRVLARGVHAAIKGVKMSEGVHGKVAEVLVRREESRAAPPLELRVAVLGGVDSGKSTLVGVLTKGALDNGRGLARMKVFRYNHEVANGRTSSISHHIMGFKENGQITTYSSMDASPLSAEEVMQQSRKLISFIDLAGHQKYLKHTLSGMVGLAPDHAMLTVAAAPGGSAADTALEHLDIALALDVPLFVVVTKGDLATQHMMSSTLERIESVLASTGHKMVVVSSADDLELLNDHDDEDGEVVTVAPETCADGIVSPRTSVATLHHHQATAKGTRRVVPVFLVSNVTGAGLDVLRSFIRGLSRGALWEDARHEPTEDALNAPTGDDVHALPQVHLDDSFEVDGVGTVVAGTVRRGRLQIGDSVLLGPDRADGTFQPVSIRSIHVNRVAVRSCLAGQCVTLALQGASPEKRVLPFSYRAKNSSPRKHFKGTVLLSPSTTPAAFNEFDAQVLVLSAPEGPITVKHEPVVHAHTTRQCARIVQMSQASIGKGEAAVCTFRFLYHAEYLSVGMVVLLRGGRTLGIGRIVALR